MVDERPGPKPWREIPWRERLFYGALLAASLAAFWFVTQGQW